MSRALVFRAWGLGLQGLGIKKTVADVVTGFGVRLGLGFRDNKSMYSHGSNHENCRSETFF